MNLKSYLLVGLSLFFLLLNFSPAGFADVYMKVRIMNGMSESETWISGKKQRTSAELPMMGKTVTLTDLASKKEIELLPARKVYQIKPIALPYNEQTQQFLSGGFPAMMGKQTAGSQGGPGKTVSCDSGFTKLPGKRTYAGLSATGYAFNCDNTSTTLWFAETSNPFDKLYNMEKEMKAFHTEHAKLRFANYPEAERKKMIQSLENFGSGLAKAMGSVPHLKEAPKGFLVAMEGTGMGGPGAPGGAFYEVLEISDAKQPKTLFEVEPGYTEVPDIQQAISGHVMQNMGLGNLQGLMESFGSKAQGSGFPTNANPNAVKQQFFAPPKQTVPVTAVGSAAGGVSAQENAHQAPPGMVRKPGPNGWVYEPVNVGQQLPATAGSLASNDCPGGKRRPGPSGWICET